jgi:superfamily II DNA or RNA helicase
MQHDLFEPVSRDERQAQALKAWLQAKGRATIVAGTGFGKTKLAMDAITKLRSKYPTMSVLVVVPTQNLKEQWVKELDGRGLGFNTDVRVMMGAAKKEWSCDLLIIDEAHKINSECISALLTNTKYKLILGLTATFERLDGRHEILAKYAPICDTITMEDALLNGWVSKYKDYVVIIDVNDIETYKEYNREFTKAYEFFNWDFGLAMSMAGKDGFKHRWDFCKKAYPGDYEMQKNFLKTVTFNAMNFMRSMQARKKFVQNHPDKIKIAKEIIAHRSDKKIVTFNANVKMAESYGEGYVYTGKDGKKKNRITLEEFSGLPCGQLHSCKMAIEGLNLPDLSVGIQTGIDSSKTKAIQSLGRVVRLQKNKTAEFFTLVINNTIETKWMENAKKDSKIEIIDVENLMHVLNGEPYEQYKKKITNFTFRF